MYFDNVVIVRKLFTTIFKLWLPLEILINVWSNVINSALHKLMSTTPLCVFLCHFCSQCVLCLIITIMPWCHWTRCLFMKQYRHWNESLKQVSAQTTKNSSPHRWTQMAVKIQQSAYTQHGTSQGIWPRVEDVTTTGLPRLSGQVGQ